MTTITRYIHIVRCYASNDDGSPNQSVYADVLVIDKFAVLWNSGQTDTYDFTAAYCTPTIIDNAGSGNAIDNGNSATRQSHMVQVTNPSDSTQSLIIEVLDRFCYLTTNGECQIYDCTASDALTYVLSTTGDDIGQLVPVEESIVDSPGAASRLVIVNEVLHVDTPYPVDSQGNPIPGDMPPSGNTQYLAVEDIQNLGFLGTQDPPGDTVNPSSITTPGKGRSLYDLTNADCFVQDTTQYLTDDQGNQYPPSNTDPDPYVAFPSAADFWTGDALLSQGLLWRIINASGGLWVLISVQSIAGSENVAPNFSLSVTNGSLNDQKDFTTSFTLYMTGTVSNVIVPSGVSLEPDPIATIFPSEEVAESLVATLNEFRAAIVAAFTEVGPNLWINAETFSFSQTVFGGNDCFGSITITTETLAAGSFIQASSSDQLAGTAMSVAGIQPAVLQLWLLSMSPKAGDKADVAVDNGTGSSVITASLFKTTKPSLPNSVPGGGCPTGVPVGYNTVTVTATEPSTWEFSLVAADPPNPPTGQLTQIS